MRDVTFSLSESFQSLYLPVLDAMHFWKNAHDLPSDLNSSLQSF